jgi:hypothetical protein
MTEPATDEAAKKASTHGKRAKKSDGEADVLEAIAAMPAWERSIGERLHAIIRSSAPELTAKLWYKQPAYAKGGTVVCFFRGAAVDGERYVTLGFTGEANLDDGHLWPTAFALTGLTAAEETTISALVQRAAS